MEFLMVLYDEGGNPKLYEKKDLLEIARLISDIRYANGFIEAVSWEEDSTTANLGLSKDFAKRTIENLKKYKEIVPKEIRNDFFNFSGLEKTCKEILKE